MTRQACALLLTLALLLSLPTAGAAMMSQPDAGDAALSLASATVAEAVDAPVLELAAAANGTAPAADTVSVTSPKPVFCYVVQDSTVYFVGVMHLSAGLSEPLKTAENDTLPTGDLCCYFIPNDSVCLVVMVTRSESGSTHLISARWYDPQTGRFISRDPVEATVADLDYNPYSYCRNNPLKYTDPTGMDIAVFSSSFSEIPHIAIAVDAVDGTSKFMGTMRYEFEPIGGLGIIQSVRGAVWRGGQSYNINVPYRATLESWHRSGERSMIIKTDRNQDSIIFNYLQKQWVTNWNNSGYKLFSHSCVAFVADALTVAGLSSRFPELNSFTVPDSLFDHLKFYEELSSIFAHPRRLHDSRWRPEMGFSDVAAYMP